MYAVTSTLLESRTRATFRSAEFGFLGVTVLTCKQTPAFCGAPLWSSRVLPVNEFLIARNAGVFGFLRVRLRGLLTSWFSVGNPISVFQAGDKALVSQFARQNEPPSCRNR